MTMMSPLGRVPQRTPRRRRANRRAWPLVVFIVVFAVAAGVVWWRAFHTSAKTPCPVAKPTPTLTLHTIQVRVYNATQRSHLAASVGHQLQADGLSVVTVANDPTHQRVAGVAQIRHGPAGRAQARILAAAVPGAVLVSDRRTDSIVDVALGPHFSRVAPLPAIRRALTRVTARPTPTC